MHKLSFTDLPLSKEVQKGISEIGYEEATQIQSSAIPVLLEGKDIIGQSQTGTGKTAAFGIPAIECVESNVAAVQVLVLCPTRELAIQVAEEINTLGKFKKNFYCLPVYGGSSIERQVRGLKHGAQIVVGTPGRILDHMERGTLNLSKVKMAVLDEADEMLNMGFIEDIESILSGTPEGRQTVMFSATTPEAFLKLTKKYQNDPIRINITHTTVTVSNTEQYYLELRERKKTEVLTRLLDLNNVKLAIVFCNTKRRVDEVVEHLHASGYFVEGLHGDMKQSAREKVMSRFRKGDTEVLVATDVAARGLDVDDVEVVFNYDLPQDEESYVHRIGRTGRAGKSGKAFTFVTDRELRALRQLQKFINVKIKLIPIPTYSEVEEKRLDNQLDEIRAAIITGGLEPYRACVERLMEDDNTSVDIAAALFKLNFPLEKPKARYTAEEAAPVDEEQSWEEEFEDDDHPQPLTSEHPQKEHKRGKFGGKDKFGPRERSFGRGGKFEKEKGFKGGGKSFGKGDQGSATLKISTGKADNIRPGDIVGAITGEANVQGKDIGGIHIMPHFTLVDVPAHLADKIISGMRGVKIKGKKVSVDFGKPKR